MTDIVLPRRNTAAGAAANNQIPMQGERVYETDTGKWKTGDGTTHYNDLPFDPGYAPTVLSNWKLSNTTKLRASLAKAKLGTGYSTHAVLGDSLSSMFDGTGFDFPNSWWRKLWRALVASGVPNGGTGRVAMSDFTGAPVPIATTSDPRISQVGGWNHYDIGYGSPTGGGTVTFTSDVAGTIVDVYYLSAGGPAFTVAIDGVAHTVTPSGGWHRAVDTTSGLANGTHTVVITAASGAADSVLLLGFRVRQASGISFDNLAVKYGIAAYNQEHDAGDLTGRAVAEDYSSDADVLWIALGANDIGMGRTPSQIVADITALRNRWSSADCVLVIEPDNDDNGAAHANYVTAMRTLAVTLDLPLLEMSLRLGTHAQMVAAQIMGPDDIHLNAVGQSDWAAVALEGVQSVARGADGLASVKAAADANTASLQQVARRRVQLTDNCFAAGGSGLVVSDVGTYAAGDYKVGVAGTDLQLGFGNWYNNGTAPDTDTDGPAAVTMAVSIVFQGRIYPCMFDGAKTKVLSPGGFTLTDKLPIFVNVGDTFLVLVYLSAGSANFTRYIVGASISGIGGFTATTDLTALGSAAPAAASKGMFMPLCIVGTPTGGGVSKSIIIQGDSITAGAMDGNAGPNLTGYSAAAPWWAGGGWAMRALSGHAGVINSSFSNDAVRDYLLGPGHFRRGSMIQFANYALLPLGVNDLAFGRSQSQLENDLVDQCFRNQSKGSRGTIVTTLTPVSSSTDKWATVGNQTTSWGPGSIRVAHNNWVRAGCPINGNGDPVAVGTSGALLAGQPGHPIVGYLEVADAVESSRDSGKWKAAQQVVTDASMVAGSGTLNSPTANFTNATHLGLNLLLEGAGAAGADLTASIQYVVSPTQVLLTAGGNTTVSNVKCIIGRYTVDGTHPGAKGHAAIAADVQASLLAKMP